jgi:hypothetical protein
VGEVSKMLDDAEYHSRRRRSSRAHLSFAQIRSDLVFNYPATSSHNMALGRIRTNDGTLTVRNPDL